MKCPKCNQRLKVTNTYMATPTVSTARRECPGCGAVYTEERIIRPKTKRGTGAKALAVQRQNEGTRPV